MPGQYRWFWNGIKHGIPLCCILFFEDGGSGMEPEYGATMYTLTDNSGVILCPECVARAVRQKMDSRDPKAHTM